MPFERIAPDSVIGSLNLTGNPSDIIDDPDSPDANWVMASSNDVDVMLQVGFAAPSANLQSGSGLQEFRVLVGQFDTNQTGTPQAQLSLYENNVLIRDGAVVNVTSGSQILSFLWDASELSNADGSLVECRVTGAKSGGSPGARNSVNVGAVEWNAETQVTLSAVSNDLTTQWNLQQIINGDLDSRWGINNTVLSDAQLLWNMVVNATGDLSLAYDIVQSVSSDLNAQWQINVKVEQDAGLVWDIGGALQTVNADMNLAWDLRQAIVATLDTRWSLLQAVQADANLRFDIANSVIADLTLQQDLLQDISNDADLRWDALSITENGLSFIWSVNGVTVSVITVLLVRAEQRIFDIKSEQRFQTISSEQRLFSASLN